MGSSLMLLIGSRQKIFFVEERRAYSACHLASFYKHSNWINQETKDENWIVLIAGTSVAVIVTEQGKKNVVLFS